MQRIKLKVAKREEVGTRQVRKLRSRGLIPGVVYGQGKNAVHVQIPVKAIYNVKGGHVHENALLDITIAGDSESDLRTVIVKEIQKDTLKGDWLHIDFKEISLEEKLKTTVPLETVGEAKGVAAGGTLDIIMHELEIECLPTDIPEAIKVDVSHLEIGDAIYVKDIPIPVTVSLLNDPEQPVVSVAAPRAEEVVAAEAVPTEGEVEEPEVIAKGKKEEGEEIPEGEAKAKGSGEKVEKKVEKKAAEGKGEK